MINSPLEDQAYKEGNEWKRQRPIITQGFGGNPQIYHQFGLAGHNGIDFRAAVGTPVFAPFDGAVQTGDQGDRGYGRFIKLRSSEKSLEAVFGHLSGFNPKLPKKVHQGDLLGYTGNTGFSSGPHLHFGLRRLHWGSGNGIWAWQIVDEDNGFSGYYDQTGDIITIKGTLLKNSLAD